MGLSHTLLTLSLSLFLTVATSVSMSAGLGRLLPGASGRGKGVLSGPDGQGSGGQGSSGRHAGMYGLLRGRGAARAGVVALVAMAALVSLAAMNALAFGTFTMGVLAREPSGTMAVGIAALLVAVVATFVAVGVATGRGRRGLELAAVLLHVCSGLALLAGAARGPRGDKELIRQGFIGYRPSNLNARENWAPERGYGYEVFATGLAWQVAAHLPSVFFLPDVVDGEPEDVQKAVLRQGVAGAFASHLWALLVALSLATVAERETCARDAGLRFSPDMYMVVMQRGAGLGHAGVLVSAIAAVVMVLWRVPRTLRAMARDRLLPYTNWLARGYGGRESLEEDEDLGVQPVRALAVVAAVVLGLVLLEGLDRASRVAASFALLASAAVQGSSLPLLPAALRPVAVLALCGAVVLAFLLDWVRALVVILVSILTGTYLHWARPNLYWGSAAQARGYQAANGNLLALADSPADAAYRPTVMCLIRSPTGPMTASLLELAEAIRGPARGALFLGHVATAPGVWEDEGYGEDEIPEMEKAVGWGGGGLRGRGYDEEAAVSWGATVRGVRGGVFKDLAGAHSAFLSVSASPGVRDGVRGLLSASGCGNFRPNLVLAGFKADWAACTDRAIAEYVGLVRDAERVGAGVAMLRRSARPVPAVPRGYIDVWWLDDGEGGLALLLAFLVSQAPAWNQCGLRVLALAGSGVSLASETDRLVRLLESHEVDAEVLVFPDPTVTAPDPSEANLVHETLAEFLETAPLGTGLEACLPSIRRGLLIRTISNSAALVFLVAKPHASLSPREWMASIDALSRGLPPAVLLRGKKSVM